MVKGKTFLAFLLVMKLALLLCSCDYSIGIVNYEIVGVPDRTVYIANVDTELDLSGLKTVTTHRDGSAYESPWGIVAESVESKERVLHVWQVIHKIDFTQPGVYEVEIYWEWRYNGVTRFQNKDMTLSHKFFIQVIDGDVPRNE